MTHRASDAAASRCSPWAASASTSTPSRSGVRLEDVDDVRQVPRRQPDERRRGRCPARPPQRRSSPAPATTRSAASCTSALRVSASTTGTSRRSPGLPTPVTFCEIFPPDDFPLYFYRLPKAPDLEIRADELDLDAIAAARHLLGDRHRALSAEPAASRHVGRARGPRRRRHHVFDLDYRPMFWPSRAEATAHIRAAVTLVDVAVGNLEECEVGDRRERPRARRRGAARGRGRAGGRQAGPGGVLGARGGESVVVPPVPVDVVNGLGAGDAFGGALCTGCSRAGPLERVLRFANAAGAIVAGRLACADAMPTHDEVEERPRGGSGMTRHRRASRPGRRPACAHPERDRRAGRGRTDGRSLVGADRTADARRRRPPGPRRAARRRGRRCDGRPAGSCSRGLSVALARPGVDGVLGTADIVEDLLLLGALEDKVVIGSMNRGGLAGTVFEIDDRFTGLRRRGDRPRWASRAARCCCASTRTTPATAPHAGGLRPARSASSPRAAHGDGRAVHLRTASTGGCATT